MASSKTFNPFPGLRSFSIDEKYLFFGREEHTVELLRRLRETRFLAVVGTSGSGKSSLVKAGVLPELHKGTMTRAGSSWEVAVMRPGGSPMTNLARALIEADLYDPEQADVVEQVRATLSRSRYGLSEAARHSDLEEGTNLLVVVDQFEELFRFRRSGAASDQAEAVRFVELLLSASAEASPPVYVVLTMRSDYLGDCTTFPGLAEAVNAAEFLIPRMNREQRRAAIEGPVKVAGGAIAPRLLHKLLNDLGDSPDQLPILQHALMRTWDVWAKSVESDALDLDDYYRIGSMAEALSNHADEVYHALRSDQEREWCRGIFEALTVKEAENRGIRRPQRLSALSEILEVPAEQLVPIIDAFRRPGVTFLMPPLEVELSDTTIIDISHESLMRVWVRLRDWVDEETHAAAIYRRVAENAELHAQGRTGLIRDPELSLALDWLQRSRHANRAWAERYRPGFAEAMAFLEQSREAAEAEEREKEAARQRELEQAKALAEAQRQRAEEQRRSAVRLRWLVAGSLLMAAAAFVAFLAAQRAEQAATAARTDAENARRKSDQMRVAAQAGTLQGRMPMRAMLLASASIESALATGDTPPALASQVLHETLVQVSGSQFAQGPIYGIDLSADGRWMVGAGWPFPTRLWRLEPGATAFSEEVADDLPIAWSTTLSHDSRRLAIPGDDGSIHLYDLTVADPLASSKRWTAHTGSAAPIRLTADGRRLISACQDDMTCRIWDLEGGAPTLSAEIPLPGRRPYMAVSPDGSRLVLCSNSAPVEVVTVWNLTASETPRVEWELPVEPGQWFRPRFSPDGRFLVANRRDPGDLQLWDLADDAPGESATVLDGVEGRYADFTNDGRYLFFSQLDHSVRLLSVRGEDRPLVLRGHTSDVFGLVSSPDGRYLATGSNDFSVRVWDLHTEDPHENVLVFLGHERNVRSLSFSPDGNVLYSAGVGGSVRSWRIHDEATLAPGRVLEAAPNSEIAAGFIARPMVDLPENGYLVAQLPDRRLRRWNVDAPDFESRDVGRLPDNADNLRWSARVSGDGRWLLRTSPGGLPELIELVEGAGEARVRPLPGHEGRVVHEVIDPASRFAITCGSDQRLIRWDLTAPNPASNPTTLSHLPDRAWRIYLHQNGRWLYVSCGDATLLRVDLDAPDPKPEVLMQLEEPYQAIAVSPDGRQLAGAGRNTLLFWRQDGPDGPMQRVGATEGEAPFRRLVFSPDGRYLAASTTATTGLIALYDTSAGNIAASAHHFTDHSSLVYSMAYSGDGRFLASGETNGTILVRDLSSSGTTVRRLTGHTRPAYALKFIDGGNRLASAFFGGTVRIWELNTKRLVKLARDAAGRELTDDELLQYGISRSGHTPPAVEPLPKQ